MDKLSENLIAQPHSDRAEATGGETELSLTDILQTVKAHWPWFLLSLFICLGVAAFYIAGASKVYSRTATVLIKDDSKGGGALSESTAFEDLNLFDIKRNVDNEVIVFQSEALMRQVVKRLHLDLSYSRHEGLRQVELYTASPVRLDFPDASPEQSFALVATPWDEKHVLLSGFSGAPYARPLKVLLGDTVQTPLGHVICYPTLSYGKDSFHHPIEVEKSNFELVLQHYHSALKSTLASKTATIVDLSLEDASAQRAEDVLNTLISVYNEAAIADKNQIMVNTAKFIQKRLAIINQELGGVDSDLANFMSENQLTDLKSQTGVYLEQGSQYNKEELQLINQRQMAQYVRDYLASPAHRASLIPANTGIGGQQGNNSDVEQQIGEYNTQLLKRNRLLSVSSDRNPVVQDLNTSLEAMRENIVRTVDNLIVGLNLRIRNTQARDKQNTRRIIQMPDQQKQMATIERQQKIKASLYLYLLNKREENAISQAMTENNARIVDPAVGPANPVAPRPRIILAFAFLLGLALPAGVLWLRDVSDTKVRGRKDLEDALAVPFLGEIPLRRPTRKEKKNKQKHFFVRANGHDPLSESFRILRTNMEFMRAGAPELKCVMFTSQVPGSGKTFMSINLALSLSATKKKVILLDLDLRKGTLSDELGADRSKPGLSQYLSGAFSDLLDDMLEEVSFGDRKLDYMQSGPLPPNPAELLLSKRFENLVKVLREHYDYIIMDCPPFGLVADAAVISRTTDLCVYVVRAGRYDRRQLPELERLYRQERLGNMALALNAVDYNYAGYYAYHHYGNYGYGYYGYGHYGKKEKEEEEENMDTNKDTTIETMVETAKEERDEA